MRTAARKSDIELNEGGRRKLREGRKNRRYAEVPDGGRITASNMVNLES